MKSRTLRMKTETEKIGGLNPRTTELKRTLRIKTETEKIGGLNPRTELKRTLRLLNPLRSRQLRG
jgi:hypothetical protein